ncbi:glycosyltransferase family 2 protein [Candidatus Roizmanbacteria bacterium]|nr:glycosyltransferase family 2 protein [Candidatus Roizmanbacteria bacterium]
MKVKLSVLMITKNAEELLEKSLNSLKDLADELVIVDDYSDDSTVEIAKNYGAKVFLHREEDFGKQRKYGLNKVSREWVLVLDADEVISEELKKEIVSWFHGYIALKAFKIPFQNHFLGRPVNYGGEDYKKLILFKKDAVKIDRALVHEHFEIKQGKVGELKNKVLHYSYRSLRQMFRKFTDYAIREARQKSEKGERTNLKKIFLYPIHMFWARFVESKGYKDGLFRILLDIGFAYMEFVTYILLLFYSWRKSNIKYQISK